MLTNFIFAVFYVNFFWPCPIHVKKFMKFWSKVNQKAKIVKDTLKLGPLNIQNSSCVQIFPKIESLLPLVIPYSDPTKTTLKQYSIYIIKILGNIDRFQKKLPTVVATGNRNLYL